MDDVVKTIGDYPIAIPINPVLSTVRDYISYVKPEYQLSEIKSFYKDWLNDHKYYGFRLPDGTCLFSRVAKKGNSEYVLKTADKLFDAFDSLKLLKDVKFHDMKKERDTTNVLFMSITRDRSKPLFKSWKDSSKAYNLMITRLRRQYGRISVIKVIEAHKDDYPHYHAVMVFHDKMFHSYLQHESWSKEYKKMIKLEHPIIRISEKKEETKKEVVVYSKQEWVDLDNEPAMEIFFPGNTDVKGVQSIYNARRYLLKYLDKASHSTNALTWFFGKRFFSISGHITKVKEALYSDEVLDYYINECYNTNDLISIMANSNQTSSTPKQKAEFLGIFSTKDLQIYPDFKENISFFMAEYLSPSLNIIKT